MRKTEFGIPMVYLVAGLATSAVVMLGLMATLPLTSRERFWTLPRFRNRSRSMVT